MGNWDEMEKYAVCLDGGVDAQVHMPTLNTSGSGNGASDGAFFRAVLCVRRSVDLLNSPVQSESSRAAVARWIEEAMDCVKKARNFLATKLAALSQKVTIRHAAIWFECNSCLSWRRLLSTSRCNKPNPVLS